MPQTLSLSELRRHIGEPDFSRGQAYFAQKSVKTARLEPGNRKVFGEVLGSGPGPYRQDITLNWGKDGVLRRLTGHCSCPVSYNCKHVTAVMLTLLPQFNEPEPDQMGDDELGGWLNRLDQATSLSQPPMPKAPKEKLYYILRPTPAGALEFDLQRVRILKSGELSKTPQSFNLPNSSLPLNADFLTVTDVGILGKFQHFKRHGIHSGSGLRLHASDLIGDTLSDLVQEVIATGRAKPFSILHPDLSWGKPQRGQFQWRERIDGTQQLIVIGPKGQEFATLPLMPPLYIDMRLGRCGTLLTETTPQIAHALVTMPPVPPKAARDIVKALTRVPEAKAPLPRHIDVEIRNDIKPTPILRLFAVQGSVKPLTRNHAYRGYEPVAVTVPVLRLSFDYDGHIAGLHDDQDPEYRDDDKLIVIRRDAKFEKACLDRLRKLDNYGITEIGAMDQELFGLKSRRRHDLMFEVESDLHMAHELDHIALDFSREILPALEGDGWQIEIDASWPYRFFDGPIELKAGIETSRINWFALSLTAEAGDQELDLLPAVLNIIQTLPLDPAGQLPDDFDLDELLDDTTLFLTLPDGRRAPIDGLKLAPLVRACLAAQALLGGFHPGESVEAAKLAEALEGSGIRFLGGDAVLELSRKLQNLLETPEVEPPPSLHGDLRHYQKTGYGWLKALRETGFGGVLADDMGLGKTIQALALLCQCHLEDRSDRPSLLVVPTSLIGNWHREAERFAPDLKLLILHGPNRRAYFKEIPDHHLVITTYPLIHRDHEELFQFDYELAILDEAQAVKNPAAASARRIREIKARQRLALTGTPIENNLQELWAIYDWVVPGLLGNRKLFNSHFRIPIENAGDPLARNKLASRLRPFLLRRTKDEVATDLPAKTEISELVTLEGKQRDLYETIRVAMDARVRDAIQARGIQATRITVLDALLKMRQVCCDPALVKLPAAQDVKESGKRDRLMDMLDELLADGRKVLVFSQFVSMLKLIEGDLQKRGIDYALLTGQTKKRSEQIARFQSGEVPLFLISLKAGGVGLNLTAADTVILYDPWWNPAVERQAMDRAHRIGQDKQVFVYKMIAERSVEAVIQQMQSHKQALADALFDGENAGSLQIGEGDLQALFAPLD